MVMRQVAFRLLSLAVLLGLVAAPLAGCSPNTAPSVVKADVAQSDRPRLSAPDDSGVPELVAGNSAFALDLYHALFDRDANLFYSPYSISLALAMTYAGARGQTATEMAQALHYTLPQDELHPAFNALDQALASRGEQVDEEQGERFRLHVANALWGQQDFHFSPEFLDLLAEHYGAGLRLLDFQNAPEPSRETINRWVEEHTEQKIVDLLPPGSIDSLTRLVLSNAVYFNAGWMHPFAEATTQDAPFHLLDGSTVTVPMMHESERLGYAAGKGWQAVELPYVGGELSMVVLLPDEGQFEAYAQNLDAQGLAAALQSLERTQVQLAMPRFEYEAGAKLKGALTQLGMEQAFTDDADFSGMTGEPDLYIDDVYHKAYVAVDEEGTEAAAATAVVMDVKGMPMRPVEVQVDRPFIFLIRDVQTGAILFLGHVVNPAQ
jgi:serpin B